VGIDASAGLLVAVSDAGNGRVQLFSRDGRFLEAVPISTGGPTEGSSFLESGLRDPSGGRARPIAVRWSSDERLFVLDAGTDGLVILERDRDRQRRVEIQRLEGLAAFRARSLAVLPEGGILLPDAASGRVLMLDPFGSPDLLLSVAGWEGTIGVQAGSGSAPAESGRDTTRGAKRSAPSLGGATGAWLLARDRLVWISLPVADDRPVPARGAPGNHSVALPVEVACEIDVSDVSPLIGFEAQGSDVLLLREDGWIVRREIVC
jgi:hypothetical protein